MMNIDRGSIVVLVGWLGEVLSQYQSAGLARCAALPGAGDHSGSSANLGIS
jgi:hypothetical protein